MLIKKSLWLPLTISLEITIVVLYAVTALANGGQSLSFLDVNGSRTLPSLLQAAQLFLLGALPLYICITYRNPKLPPSRNLLACTAVFFLYASVDELFKLSFLSSYHKLVQLIYLSLGLAIPILFYRDFIRLYKFHPRAVRWVGLGLLSFVIGGFGLELFRSHVQEPHWYQLFGRWEFYQVDAIRTALEELGEMVGETLVLKGMVDLVQRRRVQSATFEIKRI